MSAIGTIVAIIIALLISLFIGPTGTLALISVGFGLVLSMYIRNREMYSDIQRIKEKLGIEDKDDFNMSDEEIENELLKDIEQ
ncbi:hypothetical protein [Paenibacillus lentus]|uniref:Uncharacterized protein n=1 Tax=Paenibacillus lentus TaxID=1338368 RepID=A0A3Q8S623_9BACL|nr:hypothetical protein [Paenibacillus lentus]AZK47918.1 hypothetical protein EIM92_18550 [Paenibacillus lentus]